MSTYEQVSQIGLKALQKQADLSGINGKEAYDKAYADSPHSRDPQTQINRAQSVVNAAAVLITALKVSG